MNGTALWSIAVVVTLALLVSSPGVAGLMLASRRRSADGYAIMERTLAQQAERLDESARREEANNRRIEAALARISELERGLAILSRQLYELGAEPAWKPEPPPSMPAAVEALPIAKVAALLAGAFTEEELADLAMMVDIDLDDVPGSTRRAKAKGLATAARDRGELAELIAEAAKERPRTKWEP